MHNPIWLSRLELDLVRSKRKKSKSYARVRKSNKDKKTTKTDPVDNSNTTAATAAAADATTTTTDTYPSMLQPQPQTTVKTLHDLYPPQPPHSDFALPPQKKKLHPLLKTLKGTLPSNRDFDRMHLQNARLGEILVPVRKARTTERAVAPGNPSGGRGGSVAGLNFGPASPTNKHLKKVLMASGNYEQALVQQRAQRRQDDAMEETLVQAALKQYPLPLSKDLVLSPKKWKIQGNSRSGAGADCVVDVVLFCCACVLLGGRSLTLCFFLFMLCALFALFSRQGTAPHGVV